MTDAPAWLSAFQAEFGSMLREPLDRQTGKLATCSDRYPEALCAEALPGARSSARERLAVYNRQYWLRLLTAMQHEFRLTTRLLGPWHFNGLAADFLCDNPPVTRDLAAVADGFEKYLVDRLAERRAEGAANPPRAIQQAARIDQAFRTVFRAPRQVTWSHARVSAEALMASRLVPSAAVALVEEDWPLLRLRQHLPSGDDSNSAAALPLPAPYPGRTRFWAVVRSEGGQRMLRLSSLQARLYMLLIDHPVGEALAQLEAGCTRAQGQALPSHVQRFLAQGMEHGFWTELSP